MDPDKSEDANYPSGRRVARESFDETYWGIRLSDIDDEFYLTKGNETLYIDASGEILIRTHSPGQPVETGRSYDSTEAMYIAEKRWNELRDYQKKVADRVSEREALRVATPTPLLEFVPDASSFRAGEICRVGIVSRNLSTEKNRVIGIAMRFHSAVLTIESYEPGDGVTGLQYSAGPLTGIWQTARFMVACAPGVSGATLPVATLRFRGVAPGQTSLEPLAVEANFAEGNTFIDIDGIPFKPLIEPVNIHVS